MTPILVPDPGSSQGYNRYAYCANNPIIYTDPSGHSWLSDVFDSLRDQFDPIKIFENGGVLGVIMWGMEPVSNSFSYTHDGGAGTGGGWSYYGVSFGASFQEKGDNQGLTGYVGVGYSYGNTSIGLTYTRNHTQGFGYWSVGISYAHSSGVTGGLSYNLTYDSWSGSISYDWRSRVEAHNEYWDEYQTYIDNLQYAKGVCAGLDDWMIQARRNRQVTNQFFNSLEGKITKGILGKLHPSMAGTVAATGGTVTMGQAIKSIAKPGLSGIRGFATLGVSGTLGSAALTTAIGTGASWLSWKGGLYIGSYIGSLPALFK